VSVFKMTSTPSMCR